MSERTDLLNRVRVATPCPASWEAMDGDERVRLCRLCNLNVYNIAALTKREAESLIARTEGRLCGRVFRRADGTIMTKDCPVGVRALRRRVSHAAAVAFAALLSVCAPVFGQKREEKLACPSGGVVTVKERKTDAGTLATLSGIVVDPTDALVPGAEVTALDEVTKKTFSARASDKGEFKLAQLPAGTYTISFYSPGFMLSNVSGFKVGAGEDVNLKASLVVGEVLSGIMTVAVPVQSKPDFESSGGKTVIRGRMLTDLPLPR